jgi:MoaA/NifB/PqqE/SkfB family radical SAM enzyme
MLVKAEILWTRECPLRCHYCNMVTGMKNSQSSYFWRKGLDNLKKLDCKFIAIYGAEPLADYEKLPNFVEYARYLGMDITLITSGCAPHTNIKLRQLYDVGLRSLTTSYDIIDLDPSSAAKSKKALDLLKYFRKLGPVDNVAVVVTLTKKNYKQLYNTMVEMTAQNIWTFFDLIHPDRNQPGSKSKGSDPELLFAKEDLPELVEELKRIREAKGKLMIHASSTFLEHLINHPDLLLKYDWNCAKDKCFPSWVTVDCTGLVYACDDFQEPGTGIPLDKLYEKWPEAQEIWKKSVVDNCPGCAWNTHLDAHNIKNGLVKLTEYVHK